MTYTGRKNIYFFLDIPVKILYNFCCCRNANVICASFLYAQIAQLVEQRTENPRVTGSIPVLGIFS